MAMKDTYDYNSKQEVREELRTFINKNYSRAGQRKKLKILTMLGHEDHELKTVWDPLGIKRENITVVEYNSEIYDIIKSKNLGINLVKGSIDDYILKTKDKFDIINLDYQGYYDPRKRDSLKEISYREILGDKGILATWFYGRRENLRAKAMFSAINPALDDYDFDNSLNSKEDVISRDICASFLDGHLIKEPHPLIDFLGLSEEYYEYIRSSEKYKTQIDQIKILLKNPTKYGYDLNDFKKSAIKKSGLDWYKILNSFKKCRNKALNNEKILFAETLPLYLIHHRNSGVEFLSEVLSDVADLNCIQDGPFKDFSRSLNIESRAFLKDLFIRSKVYSNFGNYFSSDTSRFKYINDSKAPMLVDFNFFKKIEFDFFDILLEEGLAKIIPNETLFRKDQKLSKETHIFVKALSEPTSVSSPRVFVGYNNKSKSNVTMKEQGIKAGRPKKNLEEKVEKPEVIPFETKKEELSKKDAVYLLQEGFTPKDVAENFPGVFTVGQLAALKAWYVTMGKEFIEEAA